MAAGARLFLVVVGAAGLAACVAESVERRRPRRGPVPEVGFVDPGGGEVRYSAEGWSLVVAARRRDARRRMKAVCKKPLMPKITDEFTRDDVDVPYHQQEELEMTVERGLDHFVVRPYHHVVFECVSKEAPPQVSVSSPTAPAQPAP